MRIVFLLHMTDISMLPHEFVKKGCLMPFADNIPRNRFALSLNSICLAPNGSENVTPLFEKAVRPDLYILRRPHTLPFLNKYWLIHWE